MFVQARLMEKSMSLTSDQIDKIISKHKESIRLLLRLKRVLPKDRYRKRTVEDAWGQPVVIRTPIEDEGGD